MWAFSSLEEKKTNAGGFFFLVFFFFCFFFLPNGGIKRHCFAPYAFLCQMPFVQTGSLLPPVTWQQNIIRCWWEASASTAMPQISVSAIVGQHHKMGGINFESALI